MGVDDIHASKRSHVGNGDGDGGANAAASGAGAGAAAGLGQEQRQLLDEEEEDGQGRSLLAGGRGGAVSAVGVRALRPWNQHSTASRIYRVSRALGGKDRHSKVMTAKGLRDRRVRLSVSTAIQFYDLQDRLGCDQPSKAIEWLIKAAAAAISDLPSLDGAFPEQPSPRRQPRDEEKPAGGADEDEDEDEDVSQLQYPNHHQLQCQQEEQQTPQRPQQQRLSLTKSTCSSTSETSKGSVLSLSRSEIRVKARERARERTATARDKEKDMDEDVAHVASAAHHQSVNHNPTSHGSFTELLTGGGHQNHHPQHNHGPASTVAQANPAAIHKQLRQLPSSATTTTTTTTTTDYFGGQVGFLGTGQKPHQPTIFPAQTHFAGNGSSMGMVPFNIAAAAADHPEMQQHYIQEHLIPFAVTAARGDYINFSISSGFNRGTLQSNSPSPLLHHHLQMFSSPVDGSNLPFFLGAAAAQAASASGEGQLPAGFDSRLQLCYRHPDLKGKGKN